MIREVITVLGKSEDDNDGYFIIPGDYIRKGVVPIFIRCRDDQGRRIHFEWLQSVEPVAHGLRFLARRFLRDEWRVSELAEAVVHMLSRRCGADLGDSPSNRIFVNARWRALDWAVGGRRARILRDVELIEQKLEEIPDSTDLALSVENRDLLDRLERLLAESDRHDRNELLRIIQLSRLDLYDELSGAFGIPEGRAGYQAKNTLRKRFFRIMRRLVHDDSLRQRNVRTMETNSQRDPSVSVQPRFRHAFNSRKPRQAAA